MLVIKNEDFLSDFSEDCRKSNWKPKFDLGNSFKYNFYVKEFIVPSRVHHK